MISYSKNLESTRCQAAEGFKHRYGAVVFVMAWLTLLGVNLWLERSLKNYTHSTYDILPKDPEFPFGSYYFLTISPTGHYQFLKAAFIGSRRA